MNNREKASKHFKATRTVTKVGKYILSRPKEIEVKKTDSAPADKLGRKMIVAVDFDGPIHSYKQKWIDEHTIPDPPTEGAKAALTALIKVFDVIIHSSRCRTPAGMIAVRDYLRTHKIPFTDISATKPPAWLTIDDRCVCFDGKWGQTLDAVENFVHFQDVNSPEDKRMSRISRTQFGLHQVRRTLHV